MGKIIGKIKNSIDGISWPKPKEIIADTILTVSITAVLSALVFMWTTGIEYIVDLVLSIF